MTEYDSTRMFWQLGVESALLLGLLVVVLLFWSRTEFSPLAQTEQDFFDKAVDD